MPRKLRAAPVTPAEFLVLGVLWDLGVGTVAAVHDALPAARKLAYNTVLTQVRLLHAKGYLQRESVGRAHVYRPRWSREQVLRRVVRHFAEGYFDGDAAALADFLAMTATTDAAAGRSTRAITEAPAEAPDEAPEIPPPATEHPDSPPI